jgi:hypothetical protein
VSGDARATRLAGVGVFVLGGLALFTLGLFMIGDRQMAFADKFVIYAEFARITGLQPGAIVRVSGAKAGSVKEIRSAVRLLGLRPVPIRRRPRRRIPPLPGRSRSPSPTCCNRRAKPSPR